MARLQIKLDKDTTKLILGGYGIWYNEEEDDIEFLKILGIYKGGVEGFNIVSQEIQILKEDEVKPAKLTIDDIDVSKESYRIFVYNLNKDYEYIVHTYSIKPKVGEKATVVDMKLLNGTIFNKLSDKTVIIGEYNHKHHNYSATTTSGAEIFLRRTQFTIENNTIDIAELKNINE